MAQVRPSNPQIGAREVKQAIVTKTASDRVAVPGYRVVPSGSRVIGSPDPGTVVRIAIYLKTEPYVGISPYIRSLSPTQASGQGLSAFNERAESAVESFFNANGFSNIWASKDGLDVFAEAPIGVINKAFAINIKLVQIPTKGDPVIAPDRAPSIPMALSPFVNAVIGLDTIPEPDYPLSSSAAIKSKQKNPKLGLTPAQLATIYNIDSLHQAGLFGDGQRIYIFSFSLWNNADTLKFAAASGIPISKVNAIQVATYGAVGSPQNGQLENDLDIQTILGQAPNSSITLIECDGTPMARLDALTRIVNDNPQIVSISWGADEDYDSPELHDQWNAKYKAMSLQGQAVFVASGDNGSLGIQKSGINFPQVEFPASSPYVTSVGGTELVIGLKNQWISETGWAYSDGGLSRHYQLPNWQKAPGAANQYSNGYRQLPDVAALAGFPFYQVYSGGMINYTVFGTSGAAPLWASAACLMNQQFNSRVGPFGPATYSLASQIGGSTSPFHDITVGSNASASFPLYPNTKDWDYVTGIGSANFGRLATKLSDNATFIADVTIADGTHFKPGASFTKTWRIANSGTKSWGSGSSWSNSGAGYTWSFDGGDQMSAPQSVPIPQIYMPGDQWDASVTMKAPLTPGTYKGFWRARDPNGQAFGQRMWVSIIVDSNGVDGSSFVTDVTVPDGTPFGPGQPIHKVWRIKNTGSTTWGSGYSWTFDGGDKMSGSDISVPSISPGSTWDPAVDLVAPTTPGTYKGYWRMKAPNGQKFGTQVWVSIIVTLSGTVVSVSESDTANAEGAVGFFRQGTPKYWHDDTSVGDGGHMLWTQNNDAAHGVDNVGEWRPNLPNTGTYEVFVFIPRNHATTKNANYTVYAADGPHSIAIDQSIYFDVWVSLGKYSFNTGTSGYLKLVDLTNEKYISTQIGFDTAKWVGQ